MLLLGLRDEGEDLDPHCPIELSGMMAMFYVCAVSYGSYKSPVASQSLRLVCDGGSEFFILFHFNYI